MPTITKAQPFMPPLKIGDPIAVGNTMFDVVEVKDQCSVEIEPWPWWRYITAAIGVFFRRVFRTIGALWQRER